MTMTDSAPGESAQPRRVLLVDDSVDAAEAMSMLLETLGHEVRVMHDGPSALAMVDDFAPGSRDPGYRLAGHGRFRSRARNAHARRD